MKGAHSPVAEATLTTQLPDAGAVPRVVKEVEGETLPFFEDETALGHFLVDAFDTVPLDSAT